MRKDNSIKYLVQCRFCGTILMKTENIIFNLLVGEIKCPNKKCGKLCKIPDDILINPEQKRRKCLAS